MVPTVGLFVVGAIVTLIIVAGIALLFYAAVEDGRAESERAGPKSG